MNRSTPLFLLCALLAAALLPASASAAFGLSEFDFQATDSAEAPATGAGTHPAQMTTILRFNKTEVSPGEVLPDGEAKNIQVRLPEGLVGNPTAVPTCANESFTEVEIETFRTACDDSTAVGIAAADVEFGPQPVGGSAPIFVPVYNLQPLPGEAARFGFIALNEPVTIDVGLSTDPPYRVIANVTNASQVVALFGAELRVWGNPANPVHDTLRGHCIKSNQITGFPVSEGSCPAGVPEKPFLTLPRACEGPLSVTALASSWADPGTLLATDAATAPSFDGCEKLGFAPTIKSLPSSGAAESPTGLDFDLEVEDPELTSPTGTADSDIEKAVVTLPEAISTNPSVANGLGACSLAQYEAESGPPLPGVGCPESSKVGSVEVETPLLDKTLGGSVYVAKQGDNPFHNLLTIYTIIENPELGIHIRLAGKVEPDPVTGQLTTTFDDLPQLPFSRFHLHFRAGERAPLITPPTCGKFTATALLYPYADPTSPLPRSAEFTIGSGAGGAPCASSPAQLPNSPGLDAGTLIPTAGAYSPFHLKLTRPDGSQRLSSITTTLPQGLLGKLAGIPYCSEAQIAAAQARSGEGQGAVELASPSCPPASELGTVTVGAGAGSQPLYVQGKAYLAGPYKGAPLSLEIITPAIAGPFDLGVVAVRTALNVDLRTAQITAQSDPIPTILHGLPLDVRSVAVDMSRSQFTLNPTSCEPKAILAGATSVFGASALLSQYFQASDCGALKFRPHLSLSLDGPTRRAGHPALKAVLTYPKGASANIARAQVGLPHSEFLDQGAIKTVCTQPDLKAGTCPKKSIYGRAKAWSPLLDKPLEGPVYLGVGYGHTLPDLVADLDGQIRVLLNGTVDTTKKGGLRNTFEAVPDAPVSKFVLELKGGPKQGLIQNSEDICRKDQKAAVRFVGHNAKSYQTQVPIENGCGKR